MYNYGYQYNLYFNRLSLPADYVKLYLKSEVSGICKQTWIAFHPGQWRWTSALNRLNTKTFVWVYFRPDQLSRLFISGLQ